MTAASPRVAICVATYLRPELLGDLMDALAALQFVKTKPELSLFIIDNDPLASGREVVEAKERLFPHAVAYHVEAKKGFSQARNRALGEAGPGVDFVAFIDDDEVPAPNWLDDLLATQRHYGAGLVVGPVIPIFPLGTPPWITNGGFFDRPRRPTGSLLKYAASGNLLISQPVIGAVGVFDERFGATGGEDTDFTMRSTRAGFTIVWCDEAVVTEAVEKKRMRVRWLCRRSFGAGKSFYRVELDGSSSWLRRFAIFGKAIGRGLEGIAWIAVSPLSGFHATVRGLRSIARAAGTISGLTRA